MVTHGQPALGETRRERAASREDAAESERERERVSEKPHTTRSSPPWSKRRSRESGSSSAPPDFSGGYPSGGRRVANDRHLEASLEQLTQVGLDAQVRRHAGQDHLVHLPLAELELEVVLLRSVHLWGDAIMVLLSMYFLY